jgi:UDP-4-amino-4,6-dideoxy-N-acetyl-beta-L-altrosamine transaminase
MKRTSVLPYGRQSIDDADIAAVTAQLREDFLTQGPAVAKFEKALTSLTEAKYAVAVANGTAALHIAVLAAGLGPGDIALVPDITFVATANAVRYAGGRPVLVDVDPDTGLVDLRALEALAEKYRPKAILPVSLAGAPPDLRRVSAIAAHYGAVVIEDAAHSLGGSYATPDGPRRSASCTDTAMAILSFHPVKHLTTGEGGAVTTNDPRLFQALSDLRTHGITKDPARLSQNDGPWYYEQHSLGLNYRITDLQCALGVSQAAKFPKFLDRRRAIAARYDRGLALISPWVRPLRVPSGATSAYHLYVVQLVPKAGETLSSVEERRKALFLGLRERQIAPQVHYIPVDRQPDFRRNGLSDGEFPGANSYYAGCLSIPMFPAMTDDDVDYVIAAISELVKSAPL